MELPFLLHLPLTLLAGGVFGMIFVFLKVPNGLRIGAMLGAALLSVFFNAASMPPHTRLGVQIVAGALIACSMEKSDIKSLPLVIKPTLIMLLTFLILNIGAGFLIHLTSPLDLLTSLLCVIPGGITDTPIVAAAMGADAPKVAIAQLSRYILGNGVFPPMIFAYDNMRCKMEERKKTLSGDEGIKPPPQAKRVRSQVKSPLAFICTLAAGLGAGILGDVSGVPAGAFLFPMVAVLILRLCFDFAYIPPWVKKTALLVSGCYIGSSITFDDVLGFKYLGLPILIIVTGYIANCFIGGKIISKTCGFNRKEGMLITTPAGASDIALSAAEIGVENTSVIIIQVLRSVLAMALFPQIINLLAMRFG